MGIYLIHVMIENKPLIRDPEGEVILKDLMIKNGFKCVKKVRTARLLKLEIEAESEGQAEEITAKMCNDLRIYNPVVSLCAIKAARGE
jgi:phosphoribosylformylglycinamidine synthase PurS subunit